MRAFQTVVFVLAIAIALSGPALGSERLRLQPTLVPLKYRAYEFALQKTAKGVPRLDWELYRRREPKTIERNQPSVVLENRHFRATIIPAMGRIRSFVHKPTRHEQLWINPAAIAIPAHNDTGFWVTWGGIECVLPRGEHGTSHALPWSHQIEEDSASRKAICMAVIEPLTGLRHTLTYAAYPDRPYLETIVRIENPTGKQIRFSHWTTALLAPGGRGELRPRTEFIVPAERFVAADRPFNQWMHGRLGPTRASPLRFAEGWKSIGDLMATPLEAPGYAAYCYEQGEAVVRTFDLAKTPGFNIWTWGYPPSAEVQQQYTAEPPNRGYVEFWNGTALGFGDDSLGTIQPGKVIGWTERMWALSGVQNSDDVLAQLRGES